MASASLVKSYSALRDKVRETLVLGQQRIEASRIRTYWQTGKHIREHLLHHQDRADYGKEVVLRLAKDIGLHDSVLRRCREFAEAFPDFRICAQRHKLSWAHYRILITIPDEKLRLEYTERADREEWNSPRLQQKVLAEIRDERGLLPFSRKKVTDPLFLKLKRGTPYTYRILDPKTVQPKEPGLLLIDLGFSCYRDLDAVTSKVFKPFDIIESVKTGDDQYKLQKTDKPESSLYTYKATVEKIVDGDTLRVVADLGFNTRTRQYLRLRGIDCPELATKEGVKARDFVQTALKNIPEILITTSHSDKYDRYLADVFLPARSLKASAGGTGATGPECYNDKDGREQYLNNLLLDKGMAVRMGE